MAAQHAASDAVAAVAVAMAVAGANTHAIDAPRGHSSYETNAPCVFQTSRAVRYGFCVCA